MHEDSKVTMRAFFNTGMGVGCAADYFGIGNRCCDSRVNIRLRLYDAISDLLPRDGFSIRLHEAMTPLPPLLDGARGAPGS